MSVVIVGAGYTGAALGEYLSERGRDVIGTSTEGTGDHSFPVEPYQLGDRGQLEAVLDRCPDDDIHCVFTAGPPRTDSNEQSLEMYRRFLEALPCSRLAGYVFLSSTSVYGDADGEWVSETTPPDPVSRSGRLKRDAERMTRDVLTSDIPVALARIGGIYGPGRNAARRYLSEDYELIEDREKYSNRIHRRDLVRALAILVQRHTDGAINITDRRPVRLRTMVEFLYRETGRDLDDVNTITWSKAKQEFNDMRIGLLEPRKKVSSQKLRRDIGFEYHYPTVFEGFRSLPPLAETQG